MASVRRRVLVVDDNADNRDLTRILLEFEGFEVRLVEDAEQALSVLADYRPKMILMDVQMPGMGGLKLQSHLESTGRHIPIVFVTGYPDVGVRDKAMQSGAVCFLTKPFNEDDLIDGLRSALPDPGQQ